MFQQPHIKICVIIVLHLHIVCSYRVHRLDVNEENEMLSKLREILQGYEIPSHAEARPRKSRYRPIPLGKSMLVNRIIPHGHKRGEYDSRLNTVLKPLFRYHVAEPNAGHERPVVRKNPKQSNSDLILLIKKDPKMSQDLMSHIKNYFEENEKQKHKWKKNKNKLKSILKKMSLNDELKLLRFFDKSGELSDPFAPGKFPSQLLPGLAPATVERPGPKVIKPEYPFWNYWTYQKTIVQDKCPGNLIKVGSTCVSPVGHRKNARRFRRYPKR